MVFNTMLVREFLILTVPDWDIIVMVVFMMQVRKFAQGRLNSSVKMYLNDTIIEKLVDILKHDSNIHHEKFKVTLFFLLLTIHLIQNFKNAS